MDNLVSRVCVPCRGDVPALNEADWRPLFAQLDAWEVVAGHHLAKEFAFPDFASALVFVNQVGAVAEQNGHHPNVLLCWGKVRLEIFTHKIDGLTESDFVLAAKCDAVRNGEAHQ